MAFGAKGVRQLGDLLNYIAGWCLLGMTALTCADVVLRIFRMPIIGTYELVGFLGAAVAAFAMAHTTLKRGHVAVEVLVLRLPPTTQKAIYFITHILSIFLFVLLAYESMRFGNDLRVNNEVSLTLQIPFFPILYGIAFSAVVVCIVLLVDILQVISGKKEPWYLWED
ncbi:MAG: TRAP transporter small permease [Deltaproteobacteria bacterium]|nr:TRAP transporter small permease [Deltaproteobacteria bacterium]